MEDNIVSIIWSKDADKIKSEVLQDNCMTNFSIQYSAGQLWESIHIANVSRIDAYTKMDVWQNWWEDK